MNRAAYPALLILLATVPCAAGDKGAIVNAVRSAVSSQTHDAPRQTEYKAPAPAPSRAAEPVSTNSTSSSSRRDRLDAPAYRDVIRAAVISEDSASDRQSEFDAALASAVRDEVIENGTAPKPPVPVQHYYGRRREYCQSFFDCPFGSWGYPNYYDLHTAYRNFSDSELWDICLGYRLGAYGFGRSWACLLLASPDPWRPVDVPSRLERGSGEFDETDAPCVENQTLNRKRPPRDCEQPPESDTLD